MPNARGAARRNGSVARQKPGQTGEAFITAATSLFAQKGFNGTSISDLADELGLTTASLYYHMSGKQDLLFRVLDRVMTKLLSQLEDIVAEDVDPRQKLRLAVENHLQFVLTNQKEVAVFLRERRFLDARYGKTFEARVDRYDELFTNLVEQAIRDGSVPAGDAALLRFSILGMINWIVEWYHPRGRLTQAQIVASMTDLIMDRLLAPPQKRARLRR